MTLNDVKVGDVITHKLFKGEGEVKRIGVGPKNDQLGVLFLEESEFERFVELKSVTSINGKTITASSRRTFKPTNYEVLTSQHFTETELEYFQAAVVRIVYRPHPLNFENFKENYAAVTGQVCPLEDTNRSETAWGDCAEIYLSIYPPAGMISSDLKQDGDLWFFENVGVAWKLFECGFTMHVQ